MWHYCSGQLIEVDVEHAENTEISSVATDWNEICESERSHIESRCGRVVVLEHIAIWRSLTTPKSSDVYLL